jgi:hypothetical protein
MQLNIDLGSYSAERGLSLTWVPGYSLRVVATDGEVVISGNEQGLRSLAQHLLTLADGKVPAGVHAHIEPSLELDDNSVALILDKRGVVDQSCWPIRSRLLACPGRSLAVLRFDRRAALWRHPADVRWRLGCATTSLPPPHVLIGRSLRALVHP